MNRNRKLRSRKRSLQRVCPHSVSENQYGSRTKVNQNQILKKTKQVKSILGNYYIKSSTNVFKLGDYAQTDSILLKYSVEVIKAGVRYFTWSH